MIAALLGATPMSGYSSNVGILSLTDTFSRHVFKFVGFLLIIIGFSNKLSVFISVIPSAAIAQYVLGSSIASAALLAIILNKLLPEI